MSEGAHHAILIGHFVTVAARLDYVERKLGRFGPDHFLERESAALTWALDELTRFYPSVAQDAKPRIDGIRRVRAERGTS